MTSLSAFDGPVSRVHRHSAPFLFVRSASPSLAHIQGKCCIRPHCLTSRPKDLRTHFKVSPSALWPPSPAFLPVQNILAPPPSRPRKSQPVTASVLSLGSHPGEDELPGTVPGSAPRLRATPPGGLQAESQAVGPTGPVPPAGQPGVTAAHSPIPHSWHSAGHLGHRHYPDSE